MSTGIRQDFSPTKRLPSHKDTGIGAVATREAYGGVKRVLEKQASQQSAKKRKRYIYIYILTSLTPTEPKSAVTQLIVTTREFVKIEGGAKVVLLIRKVRLQMT